MTDALRLGVLVIALSFLLIFGVGLIAWLVQDNTPPRRGQQSPPRRPIVTTSDRPPNPPPPAHG